MSNELNEEEEDLSKEGSSQDRSWRDHLRAIYIYQLVSCAVESSTVENTRSLRVYSH
jgi:hypothetical protein